MHKLPLITLLVLLVLVSGCEEPLYPEDDHGAACDRAAANLKARKCKLAQPTPAGVPFAQVCRSVEASGAANMHPECLARVEDCEVDVRACRRATR